MGTITLPNVRSCSDITFRVSLTDNDVAIDWHSMSDIRALVYSDEQRAVAGRCSVRIDSEDGTILICDYSGNKPQYLGINSIIIRCKYEGRTKTFDKQAINIVARTNEATGSVTIDDPDVDVELVVEDVDTSILDSAIAAAFDAAEAAEEAAAAAQHMVDIHEGPVGPAAGFGFVSALVGTATGEPNVTVETSGPDTAKDIIFVFNGIKGGRGDPGETPDISIGEVTTGDPGTPAGASMTGTPAAPVLNLTIPKGDSTNVYPFKGYFPSSAALSSAYPSPLAGDYAYVKNSGTPATANIYAESSGDWADTGIAVSITDLDSVFPLYAKQMLIATLEKVAWTDTHGQAYLNELRTALMGAVELESISAVFNTGGEIITDANSLDDLRQYLTVTATYTDSSSSEVTGYTLSGNMAVGTNIITVTYMDKTDTFSVTVVKNYADALSGWYLHPNNSIATHSNGVIKMKCSTSTDQSNFNVWCADRARTLWSAVNGKTIKVRIKANTVDITVGAFGLGVYQNASITSLGASYARRMGFQEADWTLASDGWYETTFVCDIASFTYGSLTPGTSATFGLYCYARSLNDYIEISGAQIIDVTP